MLVKKLFEETGPGGQTNVEILRRYAYKLAAHRNMPIYIVEDAISDTFEILVKEFKKYDTEKSFRTWAITILRNSLYAAAKKDAEYNKGIGASLDSQSEDGQLTMESVLGYTYGAEDLINAEERQRFVAMAKLARKVFGYYSTVIGGEAIERSIYEVCVESYKKRDGTDWLSRTAREVDISKQVLFNRQMSARRTWQEWNAITASEG